MKINNTSIKAVHEVGHLIMYLINCKEEMKLPRVYELSIIPRRGKSHAHISKRTDSSPEYVLEYINSDLPAKFIEAEKHRARKEIRYLLAGYACELILVNWDGNFKELLPVVYKREGKYKDSDMSLAIAYNIAIGGQTQEDGVLPLISYLEDTIKVMGQYWDKIIEIATILQNDKVINEDKLEALTRNLFNK